MEAEDTSDDQVGSQDEYEIALAEGIDDEALLDAGDTRKFSITSYGADYSVEVLIRRMKSGSFTVPEFQRRFVWSQRHASKFIESLLMGLPVPGIFLYKELGTNKHLVIDGQQRLRSLVAFHDGTFGERKFRLLGIREPWNEKSYKDLDPSDQLKIDDAIIHATIFQQDEPADVLDSIYFVFERINSGGIRLSPQEIRNCITSGPFNSAVRELNKSEAWRRIFGSPENKRAKDQELIVRFFAMHESASTYTRPMATFLNEYTAKANKHSDNHIKSLMSLFIDTTNLIDIALNGRAFRPARTFNAAVFDGVMTGLAARLTKGPPPAPDAVSAAYDLLLADQNFRKAWVRATADEESVKARLRLGAEAFNGL
ncbi:DUF262 domain-containing protein [Phenylobacterium conjunctum]|uniref:DUF262 domain-containing protein n=1 Tax=Phenylobacterium conjunctum TaxID=1298959 RepID=A0ABW3SWG5_9CAUL